jgi:hypothetical protein
MDRAEKAASGSVDETAPPMVTSSATGAVEANWVGESKLYALSTEALGFNSSVVEDVNAPGMVEGRPTGAACEQMRACRSQMGTVVRSD